MDESEEDEIGVWYENDAGYGMIDPETGGIWLVESEREETAETLDELLDVNIANGMERPSKGMISKMIRVT